MPDLREVLEAKYDELDAEAPASPVEPSEPVAAVSTPAEPENAPEAKPGPQPRDETGKFAPKEEAPKGISPKQVPIGGRPPEQTTIPTVTAPVTKAPQSWKPIAREEWAKVPPAAQQEILRLELDTKRALERAALAEKGHAALESLTRPYEAVIRQTGMDAPKYVESLLQTAYRLNTADPRSRAAQLADLVIQFQVTPQDLDAALVARYNGQPPQQQTQQGPYRDPRVDELLSTIRTAQQQREEALATEAGTIRDEFAQSHEFLEDVREEMADIIDLWAKRGKSEVSSDDLERAYNIACQNNPDVAPIMEQRRAAQEAQKAMASTARSRAAASSVSSEPSAPMAVQPSGRREILEAKWDELQLGK